ncbi:MAG: exodeoxyribonuclease VII large subunit [Pirellulales bacterium]
MDGHAIDSTASDDEDPSGVQGLDEDNPLSVTQLTLCIKSLIENSLPRLWVEGEVSDLSRPSSGHLYFTLKDAQCQIRAVMWRSAAQRLPFRLEDGAQIICAGGIEVYPPRGSYQMAVTRVQPQGVGGLQLAFRQLHAKLAAEGCFDAERKKPLPKFPRRIAFVTSPSGAALHDFIEAAAQRWPLFELTVVPVRVQGEGAAEEIAAGIQAAQRLKPAVDLIIVGRGGGSLEDLWCFNEEAVVRALVASHTPTISAVGHEVDVTLSDLAADARALTPTNAAEVGLPSLSEISGRLAQHELRLTGLMHTRVHHLNERLRHFAESRVLQNPHELIKMRRQLVDEWELRASAAVWNRWRAGLERLQGTARAAHALSPLQVLARGYSLTLKQSDETLVRTAADVQPGETLITIVEAGRVESRVTAVLPDESI